MLKRVTRLVTVVVVVVAATSKAEDIVDYEIREFPILCPWLLILYFFLRWRNPELDPQLIANMVFFLQISQR
jgi:hypothetical protein